MTMRVLHIIGNMSLGGAQVSVKYLVEQCDAARYRKSTPQELVSEESAGSNRHFDWQLSERVGKFLLLHPAFADEQIDTQHCREQGEDEAAPH